MAKKKADQAAKVDTTHSGQPSAPSHAPSHTVPAQYGRPRPPVDEVESSASFPVALYRKTNKTPRWPNGYEVRRANSVEERDAMLSDGWKEHPDEV